MAEKSKGVCVAGGKIEASREVGGGGGGVFGA